MTNHELFTRHWTKAQPVVAGYLASLVSDLNEADDLLQEVAIVLLRKFAEFDEQKSFTGWALGIARYEVLSAKRSHARSFICHNSDLVENITQTYVKLAPELDQRAEALSHCIERVEGRSREALRMRYEESRTPAEIARLLDMAAGTVRVLLSRIRTSLYDCIEHRMSADGRRT
jgi:RNA polymerase sigma-70 factor (ECF subfamily)